MLEDYFDDVIRKKIIYKNTVPHDFDPQDFELFKSNVCHQLKRDGDIDYIAYILKSHIIDIYFRQHQEEYAYYMLGMLDFLLNKYKLPSCTNYDKYRETKLPYVHFPLAAYAEIYICRDKEFEIKSRYIKNCERAFLKYNIVEGDIYNVY